MGRCLQLIGFVVPGSIVLATALPTFLVNGKPVKLAVVEQGGKQYVEVQSFARALGASVTFDRAKNQYVIVSAGHKAPTGIPAATQLAGGEGELGKAYSLGKTSPLVFTLKSAAFRVDRVTADTTIYAPKADGKLLVLRYTVQNPTNRDQAISYASFSLTAVDARDVNQVFNNYIVREGSSEIYNATLKPAQKIDLVAAWEVPAAGAIPKLIVQRESGAPVLRYDLRGKVEPLPAPFADPADATGSTAREEVPTVAGTYYPLKTFDMQLEGIRFTTEKIDGRAPGTGKRYLVATIAIKNATSPTAREANYSYSTFKFALKDADGEKQEFNGYLIKATRDEHASGALKPGEEYKFRVYFALPQNTAGQTLYAREGDSRVCAFDISSVK